jgi:hypothetical protein
MKRNQQTQRESKREDKLTRGSTSRTAYSMENYHGAPKPYTTKNQQEANHSKESVLAQH